MGDANGVATPDGWSVADAPGDDDAADPLGVADGDAVGEVEGDALVDAVDVRTAKVKRPLIG